MDFHKKMNIVSRVIAKRDMQGILSQLRKNELFTVEKLDSGYHAFYTTPKGNKFLVLKAMNGGDGYLTRFDSNLFE